MKKLFLLIILCCAGCASLGNTSIQVTDEYIASIEIAKENAVKLAALSEFQTCFIRACLGSHIEKLPYEMIAALDKIDLLLVEIGEDYDLMTDCQKGQMSGLWTRLVVLGILEIIADINPAALTGLL